LEEFLTPNGNIKNLSQRIRPNTHLALHCFTETNESTKQINMTEEVSAAPAAAPDAAPAANPDGAPVKEERETWSSRTAFYFAGIGAAVGFGNVWRFPALSVTYGGGAFFVPYIMALFFIGIPITILEIGFGTSCLRVWMTILSWISYSHILFPSLPQASTSRREILASLVDSTLGSVE
jgi:hypothetical protein